MIKGTQVLDHDPVTTQHDLVTIKTQIKDVNPSLYPIETQSTRTTSSSSWGRSSQTFTVDTGIILQISEVYMLINVRLRSDPP